MRERTGSVDPLAIRLDEYLADDLAVRIHHKHAGVRNAVGIVARYVVFVENPKREYRRGIDIGDEGIGDAARLDELLLKFRCVVGDDDDPDTCFCEVINAFLQLPELRSAEGSPVSGAYGEERQPPVAHERVDVRDFLTLVQRSDLGECRTERQPGIERVVVFGKEYVAEVAGLRREFGHERVTDGERDCDGCCEKADRLFHGRNPLSESNSRVAAGFVPMMV